MKRDDILFVLIVILVFLPFFILNSVYDYYVNVNDQHGFLTGFLKFAVLATAGEMIGLRIRTGRYYKRGFGLLPRALVWGLLGLAIKAAFMIFSAGVPSVIGYFGVEDSAGLLKGDISLLKVFAAFSVSFFLNLFFAPVMMTVHKVTDTHIELTGGTISGLFTPVNVAEVLKQINWEMHWGFVLKKTIPLFWIPAHTITFLLPESSQVLFAALLGIVLGVILAFSARKQT